MTFDPLLLVYAIPLLLVWIGWTLITHRKSVAHRAVLEANRAAGLHEPPSLHPVIDPAACLGCGSCVHACPEATVLGLIDGKAALIEPTLCIGHGACKTACPTSAITLVFGTATRGVDIPLLSPQFETNVPGLYIAGELGGMGLIKNAIEQGRQAVDAIARSLVKSEADAGVLDLVVVGCGPAGIAASLGAIERGLSFVTIDQSSFGGTVAHYPRGKVVMTAPAILPLVGEVRFGEIGKEALLDFWLKTMVETGLSPRFEERVLAVNSGEGGFEIVTDKAQLRARRVLLAIGRRGTPRQLGVPGEELDKVVYSLIDPEQYAQAKVLVVGGGDSALEAAIAIAEQPGTEVTLSYRGNAFSRARAKNRDKVEALGQSGAIRIMLESEVRAIEPDAVTVFFDHELRTIANHAVIVCAGGSSPDTFLRTAGVAVETKFGTV